jgi:hypothetical protein
MSHSDRGGDANASVHVNGADVSGNDWVTESAGRESSSYAPSADKENTDSSVGQSKTGSVRKRLSLLKLGRKTSKAGAAMGSLDEE